jgi:hypothetical protein
MSDFVQVLRRIRGGKSFKMILTVSPVPLTATASGRHALTSTIYSKSTLRSIAGLWADKAYVDYFPSFEIVTNPRMHSTAFADNLRSVRDETVEVVMKHFFSEHPTLRAYNPDYSLIGTPHKNFDDIQCEEALMEAFQK